jgi:hypothetical protein
MQLTSLMRKLCKLHVWSQLTGRLVRWLISRQLSTTFFVIYATYHAVQNEETLIL